LQRLGIEALITNDPDEIQSADRVIFPGVGEAGTTMNYLKSRNIDKLLRNLNQPVLGICLGLQLMCRHSEEGNTTCIGIFDEDVKKFDTVIQEENRIKVPHMGWNRIYELKSRLFEGEMYNRYAYFVHSYYATTGSNTIASCDYGITFSAALHKNNFYATQFHPEKSSETGSQIIKNFIEL
jgi:glutamine amidotransferase